MVDGMDGEDKPGRGRFRRNRPLRVVREGREGQDGVGNEDGRDGPGREAAGRDRRREEERETGQGRAGGRGPGRGAGPADPMQPDALDEQQRRDRRAEIDVDSDPAADRDAREVAFSNAAALRDEAAGHRAEADRGDSAALYHDRWMYDADAAAGQATDPADRSLAIRDKNEHRASSVINDAESEHEDRLGDAAEAAADRQVASAPPVPRAGEERRVTDTKNAQQHSGVQVQNNPPLTDAREAPRATRAPSARKGSRHAPQAPGKDTGRERPR